MRKLFTIILFQIFVLNVPSVFSQAGQWMWVSGSNTSGATGASGTRGIPSAANVPGAMYEPAEWADKQGNLETLSDLVLDTRSYIIGTGRWEKGKEWIRRRFPSSSNYPMVCRNP